MEIGNWGLGLPEFWTLCILRCEGLLKAWSKCFTAAALPNPQFPPDRDIERIIIHLYIFVVVVSQNLLENGRNKTTYILGEDQLWIGNNI